VVTKKPLIEGSFNKIDSKQSSTRMLKPRQKDQEKVTKKKGVHKHVLASHSMRVDDGKVAQLVNMGFTAAVAANSLISKKNNLESAIEWLLLKK